MRVCLVAILLFAMLGLGCSREDQATDSTNEREPQPPENRAAAQVRPEDDLPAETEAVTFTRPDAPSAAASAGNARIEGTAIYAYDAATVAFQPAGSDKWITIRLMGVQSPDRAGRKSRGLDEPWGGRAQQAMTIEIARRPVSVEPALVLNQGKTIWGYLWRDQTLMNEWILRHGHGRFLASSPDMRYQDVLRRATELARADGLGVFNPAEPWPGPSNCNAPRNLQNKPHTTR